MSNKLLLLVIINVTLGINSIVQKLGIEKIDSSLFISLMLIVVALLSLPFTIREKKLKTFTKRSIFGYPLIVGICYGLSWYTYLLLMHHMPLSIVAPLSSTAPIIPILLAIVVLRERPSRLQSLGIPSTFVGAFILTSPPMDFSKAISPDLISIFLMVTMLLSSGLMMYFSKSGVTIFGSNRFLTLVSLFSLLLIPFILSNHTFIYPTSDGILAVLSSAVLVISMRFTFNKAVKVIPLSIMSPALCIFPIIPMAFGIFVLGESLTLLQGIGAGIAVIGIMMLSR